ncbi:MAG: hypothetical protein QM817_26885 [Archangium sp.]
MTEARELRNRLEQLPGEVDGARSGSDAQSTAEVVKYAEQIRAARSELAELDTQLAAQKDILWSRLLTLRRGQAKHWEEVNGARRRESAEVPFSVYLYGASMALGAFIGSATPLVATPAGFGAVAVFAVAVAGWAGHLRGRVERAISQAERVL